MSRLRVARLTVAAAVAAVTLTGCGALHPGVAVDVGSEQVTFSRVEQVTSDFCKVLQQASPTKQTFSNSQLTGVVASSLAMRAGAAQLAAERSINPESAAYTSLRRDYQRNLGYFPTAERDSAIEVLTAKQYVTDIETAVGRQEFASEGKYDEPDSDATTRGQSVLGAWLVAHDVQFDPRFNIAVDATGVVTAPTDTSFAVSDFAKAASASQAPSDYVAALPPNQRCG